MGERIFMGAHLCSQSHGQISIRYSNTVQKLYHLKTGGLSTIQILDYVVREALMAGSSGWVPLP